jgi:hypothetical protein
MLKEERLKLSPFVVKRYEPNLSLYIFYNAKNETFWETSLPEGLIVSTLDGTLSAEEIFEILHSNNPHAELDLIRTKFSKTFEFLLKEEFIYACN